MYLSSYLKNTPILFLRKYLKFWLRICISLKIKIKNCILLKIQDLWVVYDPFYGPDMASWLFTSLLVNWHVFPHTKYTMVEER